MSQGLVESISVHLLFVEDNPVKKHIAGMGMKHGWGFMSLIAVYALIKMCETGEKEIFCVKLSSILEHYPSQDTPTGTKRAGYELCIHPHGSGTRDIYRSLLDFARSKRLRITGSWCQRPEIHYWTWCNYAGGS